MEHINMTEEFVKGIVILFYVIVNVFLYVQYLPSAFVRLTIQLITSI